MPGKLIGAASAAKRYFGAKATGYEARRAVRPHWAREHALVEAMLIDLPPGSRILDIPVGTGRYAAIYKKAWFEVVGIDASSDMLDVAQAKADLNGIEIKLEAGDALEIHYAPKTFDAVVCTRLVNWFLPDEMARAIQEMVRVSRDRVIVSVILGDRTQESGNNPHEPTIWAAALKAAGVKEFKRIEIEPGYWMIDLR